MMPSQVNMGLMMIVIGLSLYLISMMVIGLLSASRVQSMEDFLIAGRKLPFYLAVPTIVATWLGAGACMGVSGLVYSEGFSGVIADPLGCSLALVIAGFFFVGKFRKQRLVTISDLIHNVYGKKAEIFCSFMMIPFNIGTLASQLVALGYIFSLFMGMSVLTGILVGAIALLIYTSAGGMWAVTITDFFQFLFLVLGLLLLLPITVGAVPDLSVLWESVKAESFHLLPQNYSVKGWLMYLGQWLMTGLGAIMGQDLMQRILSCKNSKVAISSTFVSALIYFSLGLMPMVIGLAGRILMPGLEKPDMLIPILAQNHFSPFIFTIFVIGLLSAIMSTADSYLLAGVSILAHNVASHYFGRRNISLLFIRVLNIITVLLALLLGVVMPSIFDLMVHSSATLFVAIFVPVTAALYFPRQATVTAAWTSMFSGLGIWIAYLLFHIPELRVDHESVLYAAVMTGGLASGVGYLAPYIYWRLVSDPLIAHDSNG